MDASKGGISGNKVLVQEINPCNIGIELTQGCHLGPPDQLRNQNRECPGSWCKCTRHSSNCLRWSPPNLRRTDFGRRNFLTINAHSHDSGRNIIFEEPVHDSLIVATNLPNSITNLAKTSTNRIIPCRPIGFNVPTPKLPHIGKNRYQRTAVSNRNPYPHIGQRFQLGVDKRQRKYSNCLCWTVCRAMLGTGTWWSDPAHLHGGAWMAMASVKVGMRVKRLLFGLQHIISVSLHLQHI